MQQWSQMCSDLDIGTAIGDRGVPSGNGCSGGCVLAWFRRARRIMGSQGS
ncbi:hypothetical protein LINGRAHAP2_LOCUS2031 [Linum grandiflorum]